jgi:NAD(P)-dependent dehydrogenase (short-subunit alcohol dehydrogenase family)
MSYFVLTLELRPQLAAAAPSRVVNTASDAHRGAKLDFDDLQCATKYKAFTAYGRSKLSNILFTRELARQLAGTGITTNSLHPGFVDTRFGEGGHGALYHAFRVAKNFALAPEKGAETIIYLASSPDVAGVTGEYFTKCARATPTKEAQDDDAARRLWQETSKLMG